MRRFFDSSALVKRYILETGSIWVRSILHGCPGSDLYIAYVTGPEIMAAFARRFRMGDMPLYAYNLASITFERHFQYRYTRLSLTLPVVYTAMKLTKNHKLRGYDAVQLATALVLRDFLQRYGIMDIIFVSADYDLCQVAVAEGLITENPNDYQ